MCMRSQSGFVYSRDRPVRHHMHHDFRSEVLKCVGTVLNLCACMHACACMHDVIQWPSCLGETMCHTWVIRVAELKRRSGGMPTLSLGHPDSPTAPSLEDRRTRHLPLSCSCSSLHLTHPSLASRHLDHGLGRSHYCIPSSVHSLRSSDHSHA